MKVQGKIQKWGNSLALRLSGPLKSVAGFNEEMIVNIEIGDKSFTVSPAKPQKKIYSEKELLKDLNEHSAHTECIAKPNNNEWPEY